MPVSAPIGILIADDHRIVREGLRLILESQEEFTLLGEAADGAEAVRMAGELHPDVILMDLRMPVMDGITAIGKIRARDPQAAIVILTTYNEDDLMVRGLRAGARGFLLKDTDRETLFRAIRSAARGETLLQPEIISKVLARTTDVPADTAATDRASANSTGKSGTEGVLSDREIEVLAEVAGGRRSKEIAVTLGITERTVKAHLASIYNKLGVDSRAAAIAISVQKGWLNAKK
ncbi:MAG: response regulator transcription factor [Anaerolineales bacterium]|nr:response regulator transcription factor [Anaerolineales bacterium]